jgi:oxygen-independent coproporphyrinogen-3 oxidase
MPEMQRKFDFHMAGIYIHIPFCKQACHYCDFHFSTNTSLKRDVLEAMKMEISLQKSYLENENIQSIYFGGGTPSILNTPELEDLLQALFKTHTISPGAEITLETNPDDLTLAKLKDFKALGINRLSIGIQSFEDKILKYLNRVHSAGTAIRSVELASEAGFQNISIDLIYAIPGLSEEVWKKNVDVALQLNPQHLSAYSLTIEEKTTFGNWMHKGKLKPVDETLAAEQQEGLIRTLAASGYRQYEISNFALPGYESRHNSSYWKGDKYLGIGPSAHSYDGVTRQHNVSNNYGYLRSIREGKVPAEVEVLTRQEFINEYILTTLRTDQGCNLHILKHKFNYDVISELGKYLRELEHQGLVILQDDHLKLTAAGRLLADKISTDLFLI